MMVFSSLFLIIYFFVPALRWMTFPCCFSRSKSTKGWSTWCKIFRLFFFLWCWYCVSFPWVSEVETEIAVTKTNCMYTASSKVVQETFSLLGLLLSLSKQRFLYDFVISLFSKYGYDCRSCVYCKVLISLYSTSMKLNSFSYWDPKYSYFIEVPKVSSLCYFCYNYGYFNFGFGS